MKATEIKSAKAMQKAPLRTPTDLDSAATKDVSAAMNGILADVFALYANYGTLASLASCLFLRTERRFHFQVVARVSASQQLFIDSYTFHSCSRRLQEYT